jgi:hypothetical protein
MIRERTALERLPTRFELPWARLAPTLVAGVLAAVYVAVSPPSGDLAAHLLRAQLFAAEGFGIWNNWWYAGHFVVMYSLLFPAVAAALTPQLAAALAAVGTAALFEPLARGHFGPRAWLGSVWFAAGTASSLYAGRLTFAFGMLPAVATALALARRHPGLATGLAVLTALCSPVAALFAALAGGAVALDGLLGRRRPSEWLAGLAVLVGALAPVGLLAAAFPEGGVEPFVFSAFWPLPLIAVAVAVACGRRERVLAAGAVLYALGTILSYAVPTAAGSNVGRLEELVAGPLAALLLWPRRRAWLLAAALPLLYLQWQAPVRTATGTSGASLTDAYYRPLLSFLSRQSGPPFRIEIPFTQYHWEAYAVAPRFPLARGWERQLDIKDDPLFYDGRLSAASYGRWLHSRAVRFVAVPDARLDYSALAERRLIDRGLPYLRLVWRAQHWRVYAVADPTPIVTGVAVLRGLGPNWFTVKAARAGSALVRVHFNPYWAITEGSGCVAPAGPYTRLILRGAGTVRVGARFALARVGASSPRCGTG